jgi:hypothetical protein
MKPHLTLRDLFWLIALVAMGLGWWVDHRRGSALAGEVTILKNRCEVHKQFIEGQGWEVEDDGSSVIIRSERGWFNYFYSNGVPSRESTVIDP